MTPVCGIFFVTTQFKYIHDALNIDALTLKQSQPLNFLLVTTHGHNDIKTELAQWADSVKIYSGGDSCQGVDGLEDWRKLLAPSS